ncbi:hypothetical protein M430DRAFT_61218 [Amorphotheca resinae ATCC 22711]|uniref:Myb-like DNA-binding domain-containing protein n=1 Tax=Amorphotheca resinae ATCC 22711 TaxID=857342 RepID=A0A2T3ATQ2_AMORE|nr:hypothetical protein M430DRAFT_61218 [Amorphotheca resinae ATCC 22711]PSS10832.1 hypothetical protein M430DRAFT_61218 [Amorphotheca resinae ATCC 22711]
MPSKIQLDENLWFLYICLQKSDLKSIDFTAVGASTNLKPPAARMRYTRLRRQIESGTLIGTHGTPFPSDKVVEKIAEAGKKRKRVNSGKDVKGDDDEEELKGKKKEKERKRERSVVKREREDSDDFESSGESVTDFGDSEDEIPLAKLRKSKMMALETSTSQMAGGDGGGSGLHASQPSTGNLGWEKGEQWNYKNGNFG